MRGAEEDLRITIEVEFEGMTHYLLHIDIEIHAITIDDETFEAEEIRDMYSSEPNETRDMLQKDIERRIENLTSFAFSGDDLTMLLSSVDTASFEEGTNVSSPVGYDMEVSGSVNLARYLDQDIVDRLDPERTDVFILGMLMSGFEFTRTVTLRAETGQKIDYLFPSKWDPFGDGGIEVVLSGTGSEPVDGYYMRSLDSWEGEFFDHFTFSLVADHVDMMAEEVIQGSIEVDWFELDSMNIGGWVSLGPLDPDRSENLDELPASMGLPATLSPGFIRFALGEGVFIEEDMGDLEEQISDEMEGSLSDKFDGAAVEIISEMRMDDYEKPVSSSDLSGVISNLSPNLVFVRSSSPVELDILEGYEREDLVGLLNGGLRIREEMESLTDDRISMNITLPDNLLFLNEQPILSGGGRNTYNYSGGFKTMGSELAPVFESEKVEMEAFMDLSDVKSHYISDMEINVELNGTISLYRIRFDPEDYDISTELDYELDYLTSDLIRLLDRMGIANRSEVENEVSQKVTSMISDLLDEEDRVITVSLSSPSMEFDGNVTDVDDESPILIDIMASGNTAPLAGNDASSSMNSREMRFLPPHIDPIIPVRTVTRTIDTREIRDWDSSIRVRFPSGSKIRAWMGDGNEDRVSELKVEVEDGYPTLYVTQEDGPGDRITLELTVGPYFAYNNVTVCFFSATGLFFLVILLIILLTVRGIVRRKRGMEKNKVEGDGTEKNGRESIGKESDKGSPEAQKTLNW
ncbi:MAG: hypothetical protein ACMUFK_04200 [Thermoplasmatota archaeon]